MLLFTHKLDTCCQAMCQECKTAKNPAFRRRRPLNRLDSVTVSTVGVNSNLRINGIAIIITRTLYIANKVLYNIFVGFFWENIRIDKFESPRRKVTVQDME